MSDIMGQETKVSMKILFSITSCRVYQSNGQEDSVRESWVKEWGHLFEYRFLLGRGCDVHFDDELLLDVPDGYESVAHKCNTAHRWALDKGYDFVFQCCTDTYVAVPRLLATGFEKHACMGAICEPLPAPGGGAGYTLDKRALSALAAAEHPFPIGDDVLTGMTLNRVGLPMVHDDRFWSDVRMIEGMRQGGFSSFPYKEASAWDGGVCTVHLGNGCRSSCLPSAVKEYSPTMMFDCHQSFLSKL